MLPTDALKQLEKMLRPDREISRIGRRPSRKQRFVIGHELLFEWVGAA